MAWPSSYFISSRAAHVSISPVKKVTHQSILALIASLSGSSESKQPRNIRASWKKGYGDITAANNEKSRVTKRSKKPHWFPLFFRQKKHIIVTLTFDGHRTKDNSIRMEHKHWKAHLHKIGICLVQGHLLSLT